MGNLYNAILAKYYEYQNWILKFLNYYIFTILSAIVSFGSISFLTHHIDETGYGYLGIFTSISFLMPSLLSLNALGLIQINIVDFDNQRFIQFRNNFITFCLSALVIVELLALLLSPLFIDFFFVAQFSIFYGFLSLLSAIHNGELIQKGKATQFGILGFGSNVLSFVIAVILIVVFNFGWEGRAWSFIIAEMITLSLRYIILSDIAKKFRFTVEWCEWKYFLTYGATLWLGLIAGWIINQSDRFILLHFRSLAEVGIYSAGAGISSFLITINSTMVKVLAPTVYNAINKRKNKEFIFRFFKLYSIIISVIALLVCAFSLIFLPYFFGEKYLQAKWVICILSIAQAFFGMYQVVGLVLDYMKLNHLKSLTVAFSAICCLVFGILLVPHLHLEAPAIGNLISFIILASLSYYFTNKKLDMYYSSNQSKWEE